MKVKINKRETPEDKPYPKLMKSKLSGAIVFFVVHGEGMCIVKGDRTFLGELSRTWDMQHFVDFDGEVVLCND